MEKENIKIRKKDCELIKMVQLAGDILVPDTKPDIINIIGVNGFGIVKKEEIMDARIRLEGSWNGTLIYLSDLGETRTLDINLDFLDNIENEKIKSSDDIEYVIKPSNVEVKILNERKINVEIIFEMLVYDYKIEEIDMISKLDDDSNIQKLEKTMIIKEFLINSFTKTAVSEDANISDQGKNIEILKKDICISNVEKKISYNKILAKAEAEVRILYLCENEIKKFKYNVPIMSFLEVENVNEENLIDLKYDIKRFIVSDTVTEKGMLNFDIEYEITCNVYNKKEITVIEDLYCLNNDIKYSKKYVNMECVDNSNNEIIEYSEKIGIEDLKNVYDYNYYLKRIKSSNLNTIEAILGLDIFYCKNENTSLIQKCIEIPFIINNVSNECNFEIESCEINSINEEYICNFKIKCIKNIRYEDIAILSECEIVECPNKENYSMIIYFVKPNDTIWNIAKTFKVSQDNLIKLNNLSNPENIMPGEKLYIMRG